MAASAGLERAQSGQVIGKGTMSATETKELKSGFGLSIEPPLSPPVVNRSGIADEVAPHAGLSTPTPALRGPGEALEELEPALPAMAPGPESEIELEPAPQPEPELPAMAPEEELSDPLPVAAPDFPPLDLAMTSPAGAPSIPAAPAKTFKVVVRLVDGNGVEVGDFQDFGTAMEAAQEVIEQFTSANGSWPFYAGRFIRPDLIVSVDLVAGL
jgi:hypothetical protein